MKFRTKPTSGSLVVIPKGLDATTLQDVGKVPASLAAHPHFARWAEVCEEAAATVADMAADAPIARAEVQARQIEALATAAHRMRNALNPLSVGGEQEAILQTLGPLADYVFLRSNEAPSNTESRPRVPLLSTDAPSLAHLLERLTTDLSDLEQICDLMCGKLKSLPTSVPKHHERHLVRWIAEAHRELFGRLPPKRSWFGDHFMPHIGEQIGMKIGHRIVGEVVAELMSHPAAS